MFDFTKVDNPQKITRSWILSKVSDNQVFAYYFGHFKLGTAYRSKLRKDSLPSVGFFTGNSGELVYKDFKTKQTMNCFQYVMALYGCDYSTALKTVASDFGLLEQAKPKVSQEFLDATKDFNREERALRFIQFRPKKWDKLALQWWRYYEITKQELKENDVYNVGQLWIDSKEIFVSSDKPRFAYVQNYVNERNEDVQGVKIYNPCDPDHKWLNSIPIYIPFGLDKLKFQSDTCFITKSQKDRIELLKIYPDVIATQNESDEAFPEELQEFILKKFKKAIVVYGADPQGVEACQGFNAKGFGYFNTPRSEYEKYGIEDPADYIRFYGLDAFKELLKDKQLL